VTTAVALRDGEVTVIGRAAPSDVILDERGLSRQHARVRWESGALRVEDLGSTNGTFIDEVRTRQGVVGPDDALRFSDVTATVALASSYDGAPAAPRSFQRFVDHEVERARALRRPVTLVALRAAEFTDDALALVASQLRPVDRIRSMGSRVALVAFPELSADSLPAWLGAAVDDHGWEAGVASFPGDAEDGDQLVTVALHALRSGGARPARREPQADGVVLVSPAMRELHEMIRRVARTTMPALILGETGVGKELTARALHDASPRAAQTFKALNCATITPTLTESVLFGHERGAFSGANQRAKGLFEQADGGTIFLDEVGELSARAQSALLRVLETKTLCRVGGSADIRVDVRVVAATHRDLESMVDEGTFREDLLYRLDALTLQVPPLRDRTEDILPLAHLFLRRSAEQWATSANDFAPAVLDALMVHDWPGNVRELKNVVERASALATSARVTLNELPARVRAPSPAERRSPAGPTPESSASLTERVEAFERTLIASALETSDGNQSEAARLLRVPRRTLAHKVKRYGLA
tara:strand:- start:463 stop:2064 length:1602 start_codon:yes stop_codon:yes gene_type:complete